MAKLKEQLLFSVSPDKKVIFSKGNLQYQASTNKWRFAEKQWDRVGYANENISDSYSGWIDLFCWGSGDNPTKHRKNSSCPSFNDWGNFCGLPTPEGTTGKWRTLTSSEWKYMFLNRTTSSGIVCAKAKVNDINGTIMVPDGWDKTNYPLKGTNEDKADFELNVISVSTWESILEPAGCVFLPAAGIRYGSDVRAVDSHGLYWSSTPNDTDNALGFGFYSGDFEIGYYKRYYGSSVRLVADIQK